MQQIKHVVALSGGKDSSAMALRLREIFPDREFEYVCTPTGDELPEMDQHWRNLEELLGAPLLKLATMTLEQCIDREQMIPNFRARFCTRILKIEPFIDYMDALPAGSIMYVGLRADEQGRLGLQKPDSQFDVEMPMQKWGWDINDVKRYLVMSGVTVPARTDCGACFYQRLGEWKDLLDNHPDRYESYAALERRMGHTFRSPGRDTWPASLDGLRVEFEKGRPLRKMKPKKSNPTKCRFCSM